MIWWGLESSCDDSALAVLDTAGALPEALVSSQIALHETYGGVVPELASREHLRNFPVLLEEALARGWPKPDRLAVTVGPGLAPCLAMGQSLARALGQSWQVPVHPVNHLRAHAYSPLIDRWLADPGHWDEAWSAFCPHLGLLVSGGNTLLFCLEGPGQITILAQTRDDAAGEALDKGAKLLGLPYPGGPHIERLAREGNPRAHHFPRGRRKGDDLFFSFSGLKTSLRYHLETLSEEAWRADLPHLCASYLEAVVEGLVEKVDFCLRRSEIPFRSLGLSGGVARNATLRQRLQALAEKHQLPFYLARPEHCGDNATMVAFAAMVENRENNPAPPLRLQPALPLDGHP